MIAQQILAVIDQVDSYRKTRDDAWQIPREEGMLLHQIALATQAHTIVEIGTSYGFSGLFWGAALQPCAGILHTIDINPAKVAAFQAHFRAAGLESVIQNHLGDAHQVIPSLPGQFCIAFIDADKPSCVDYFNSLWPRIRPGGCIITDNAVTHAAELAPFIRHVRSLPDARSAEVAVGNGIEWTIKLGGPR